MDEAEYTGKGANTTISLLHHYLEWVKKILCFIGTIVQAKTKIMPLYSTCCGMLCLVGTSLLNSHLWLLAILNLVVTHILILPSITRALLHPGLSLRGRESGEGAVQDLASRR